jgi:hypothetical protein
MIKPTTWCLHRITFIKCHQSVALNHSCSKINHSIPSMSSHIPNILTSRQPLSHTVPCQVLYHRASSSFNSNSSPLRHNQTGHNNRHLKCLKTSRKWSNCISKPLNRFSSTVINTSNKLWKCERTYSKNANSCSSLKSWNSTSWLRCNRFKQWNSSWVQLGQTSSHLVPMYSTTWIGTSSNKNSRSFKWASLSRKCNN